MYTIANLYRHFARASKEEKEKVKCEYCLQVVSDEKVRLQFNGRVPAYTLNSACDVRLAHPGATDESQRHRLLLRL